MSTSSVISQLMQVEAAPQTKLKTKVQNAQTAVASYQSVNANLKAVKSAADAMTQLSTWRATKATSSSSSVTATTTTGLVNTAGRVTFDVKSVASAQSTTIKLATNTVSVQDGKTVKTPVDTGASVTVSMGKYDENGNFTPANPPKSVTLDLTDGSSPDKIAGKLNSAGLDVRAYVVNTSDTEGVLQFTGTKTGEDYGFQVTGLENLGIDANGNTGASPATTYSKSASLQVGSGDTAYTIKSDTNTFTGLIPGVTINVTKEETGVTVNATNDVAGIANKMQAVVDSINAALGEIKNQTAYDPATRKASPLTGDFMVREMTQTVLGKISTGLTYDNPAYNKNLPEDATTNPKTKTFGSLSQFGISLSRDGQLSFDANAFTSAYNANPSTIQEAAIGFAQNFKALADKQSTSVTAVITGRKNEIDSINDQISNWDTRLATRREALQRQYAAMETALGNMKNQSTWLAGQISSLG
ncbi:flagellar filament capping protein FliD [Actinoplanes ianthinogenes]|nr:flagellar filament capping protein FliD [Actinoplanes ianthinogenes]